MQTEQTKTLVINVVTGLIVVGVLYAGYRAFFAQPASDSGTTTATAPVSIDVTTETVIIGAQISNTLRELENLKKSVADSTAFFTLNAFKNLSDSSVEVPSEIVGRSNPFEQTVWKMRLRALEDAALKNGQTTNITIQTATASGGSKAVLSAPPSGSSL